MVCLSCIITVDQLMNMAKSVKYNEFSSKLRNKKAPNSLSHSKIPSCEKSKSVVIDVLILIAVIIACGFLLYPYIKALAVNFIEICGTIFDIIKEEVSEAPLIYGFLALGMMCTIIAALAMIVCATRRCGKSGCRGLQKAPEFDIKLETEDSMKSSSSNLAKIEMGKGFFELRRELHWELEAELKKMAPPNGRAVVIFRAKCGCSVGRMEVPGVKKAKKVKK